LLSPPSCDSIVVFEELALKGLEGSCCPPDVRFDGPTDHEPPKLTLGPLRLEKAPPPG